MMEGTVVRADCVVKIQENVIETGRDESQDRDEPSRSAGCAWGMRGHSWSPLGVQKAVRGIVSGWIVN